MGDKTLITEAVISNPPNGELLKKRSELFAEIDSLQSQLDEAKQKLSTAISGWQEAEEGWIRDKAELEAMRSHCCSASNELANIAEEIAKADIFGFGNRVACVSDYLRQQAKEEGE